MKKLLCIVLASAFALSLAACGGDDSKTNRDDKEENPPITENKPEESKEENKEESISYTEQESTPPVDETNVLEHFSDAESVFAEESEEEVSVESSEQIQEITVDAFEGIDFTISGISPFCEISVNNSACTADAQLYVEYSFDKEQYANGETAIVTATLVEEAVNNHYVLAEATYSYEIPVQPEYITSLDGIDYSFIVQEQLDNIIAQAYGANETGHICGYIQTSSTSYSVQSIENLDVYFMSIKQIKVSDFDRKDMPYNRFSFVHKVHAYTFNDRYNFVERTRWCTLTATNIVKYPDGTIKWGIESPSDYNFAEAYREDTYEDSINEMIMSYRSNYNISEVAREDIYPDEEQIIEDSSAE